jgi:hypothetical protein
VPFSLLLSFGHAKESKNNYLVNYYKYLYHNHGIFKITLEKSVILKLSPASGAG